MIMDIVNPSQIVLQILPQNLDGTPKPDLLSATVRVYHLQSGSESNDLAVTDLIQSGSIWRYIWLPFILPARHYFAEYTLVDLDNITAVFVEDIIIYSDCATITPEEIDEELTEKHGEGPWTKRSGGMIIPG
jgi:hypothetical protein